MDHYQTLGVAKNATPDEIKKAYRRLASQHHPDKGGDTNTFQKIQVAYDTLSDPQKKQQYDNPNMFGTSQDGSWQQAGFPHGFSMFGDEIDPRDIFAQMFGQRAGHHRSNKNTYRTTISVSLEDVYYGKSQVLKLQTPIGQKMVNIDIPKGIKENAQLKYDNVIENSMLLVEFRIAPNLKYERRGDDLYCNQPINILDLIVGTKINFTTFSNRTYEVTVPPKTQPYMQLKIAGQGMPIYGSPAYGDQILLLKPFIPDNISDEITQSIFRTRTN